MNDDTQGRFAGIGIEVTMKDGYLYVITPIDDTPAHAAGILRGDKIIEINGESTLGQTLQESVDRMKGEPNSKVTLTISRKGSDSSIHIDVQRKMIDIKPVKSHLVQDQYAFIRLTNFTKLSSSAIISEIEKLEKQVKGKGGLAGMVLDLRNNPGGLLDEAVNVSSIFLTDGQVVSIESRDPKNKEIRYVNKAIKKYSDLPLAVLINGASASASEIVAGAIQDAKRGLILGSQSFGKGSVQQVAKIDDQTGVKLTIAQYMTRNGRKIQAFGISPDISLENIDLELIEMNKKEEYFLREVDLKNHLVATIETPEEKVMREEKEREEKKERIALIRKRQKEIKENRKNKELEKNSASSEDGEFVVSTDPTKDYQVEMAIKHLKSFIFFKSLK
jgi:carboxyl-terminal processing protease